MLQNQTKLKFADHWTNWTACILALQHLHLYRTEDVIRRLSESRVGY